MKLYMICGSAMHSEYIWVVKYSRENCGDTANKKNVSNITWHENSKTWYILKIVICTSNDIIWQKTTLTQ